MKCNKIDMWAHYADSHKGFVIIFDKQKLSNSVTNNLTRIIDVNYSGLPAIELKYHSEDFLVKNDNEILTKKLNTWRGEREVRILKRYDFRLDIERYIRFNRACICGIIFGYRMSFENCITIEKISKDINPNLKYFNAIKNLDRSCLIFNEIGFNKQIEF
jgi:hypothetical protein